MKKAFTIFCILASFGFSAYSQNLVQNPSFENTPLWDEFWVLTSSADAEANRYTLDAHEGSTSVELYNNTNNRWTYFNSDAAAAGISLLGGRSYEVQAWLRANEEPKELSVSILWNGESNSQVIYSGAPDPVSRPDWFMVQGTITPPSDADDAFLRLALRATKAADNSGQGRVLFDDFSVTLIPLETDAEIVAFSFPEQVDPEVIDPVLSTIDIEVPFGTDLQKLAPDLIDITPGSRITPGIGVVQDFRVPVAYILTAPDGITTRKWTVRVSHKAPGSASAITSFSVPELIAPATINGGAQLVLGRVPYGTDITSLVPAIEVSPGATIDPAPGVPSDFTNPLTYIVSAQDLAKSQDWVVAILVEPNTETDITSFDLPELLAPAIIDNVAHTVSGSVPFGTDKTALVPAISVSASATINPPSGTSIDFSSQVTYTVTAEDGSTTQDWVVNIQVAPNTATDITGFTLAEQTGAASIDRVTHTVDIEVDFGTSLGFLTPIILVSDGATMDPASGVSLDFTKGASYTVTAEDGISTQVWAVNVTLEAANTETDITAFSIPQLLSPAVIDNTLHTISGTVAYGTDLSARVPTIAVSQGASINPPSGSSTDFSFQVTYTVTAEDGTTSQDWVVSIVALPNTETDITGLTFSEQTGPATINNADHSIEIEVGSGTDISSLVPSIEVSPGAVIDPADGVSRDFTDTVDYLVTAEDGTTTQTWTITVSVARATGIGDQNMENIRIYPNPARAFIFVELQAPTHIRLHDLMGKLHFSADHLNGDQRIHVSEFKEGIYIISLIMEDGSHRQRKIVIR